MKRIAIFASGSGTNFEALVNETYKNGQIVLLVCDKPNAYVILLNLLVNLVSLDVNN